MIVSALDTLCALQRSAQSRLITKHWETNIWVRHVICNVVYSFHSFVVCFDRIFERHILVRGTFVLAPVGCYTLSRVVR